MAKRANPFVEDYINQSKIHVGLKQFNNNEDRLQKVYVKTLELLFKGAKRSSTVETVCVSNDVNTTDKPAKLKQLFIGKNCTLLRSGNLVDIKVASECKCGGVTESCCAYCEVTLCSMCQLSCAQCQRAYCSHCTLAGSESQVCFSCYG